MKRMLPTTQYYFSAGGNQIDFTMYPDFDPKRVLAVINTTIGQTLIYATGGGPSSPTGGVFSGTLGAYYLSLTFNCGAAGMSDADVLQIIYDESVGMEEAKASIDIVSGKAGLDINLLNSSFGGTLGDVMPAPFQDNALSIGILSGGVLEAPTININNELVVDATQSGNVPVYVSGGGVSISGSVSNTQYNSSGTEVTYNQGSSDNSTTRVAANIYNNGAALDYGTGAASTNTLRTYSNIALNGTNISTGTGGTDSGTIRVSANLYQATSGLFTTSGIVLSGYNLINNSPAGTDVSGYKSFSIQVNSTATGGAYIFEGSNDASTYKAIPVSISDSITGTIINSAITATSSTIIYYGKVNFKFLRVRTTSAITGGSLGANTILSMFDFVPVVQNIVQPDATKLNVTLGSGSSAIGSVSVTGTTAISAASLPLPTGAATETTLAAINTKTPAIGANVMASSIPVTIAVDQNVNVVSADLNIIGQSTQTAIVNNILPATSSPNATDANGYKSAMVQVVSTASAGTFIFEGCNDNINFQTIPVYNQLTLTGTPIAAAITATAGSSIGYIFPVNFRYIRLRIVSTITGGSIQAWSKFMQIPFTSAVTQIAQTTSSNLNVAVGSGQVQLASPTNTADVGSTAFTTTSTTGTITPANGSIQAYSYVVTVISGTSTAVDVQLQESLDAGTNWIPVYDLPRITAIGSYVIPAMALVGNRIRYVQTVSGTTPSVTRSINRVQSSSSLGVIRQQIDRTIVLTTIGSTTPSLLVDACKNLKLVINIGATTIAPVLQLQESDNGIDYVNIGTLLTAVASSTVSYTLNNVNMKYARAIVTTAGTSTVAGYVMIRGF